MSSLLTLNALEMSKSLHDAGVFFLSLSDVKHLLELVCKSLTNPFMFRLLLLRQGGRRNPAPGTTKGITPYQQATRVCVLNNTRQ